MWVFLWDIYVRAALFGRTFLPFTSRVAAHAALRWSGSGKKTARNDLIGIRLWSTVFSDEAWRAGHRAGIFYS